ncbi:MAG: PepSY domain-containing protein [Arenimonas sp.]|uniref:PepSY domain-containing protein n=1 Tax=Arenimonas sp. TaxID=1872635 RepID=UPI0025BBAAB9|nr:PepSY domain-containing protein [Arenimonas sp.]MBW8368285.1 PepSY domain-containing protein [Arenimonas sp.]
MLADARGRSLSGDLLFHLVDGPPGAAVSVRTLQARASLDQYVLYDRASGQALQSAHWEDFPPMAKAVATGVDIHEGSFFGRLGPWLNTVFATALVWLSVSGFMAWWRRKPADALGVPARERTAWPRWLTLATAIACLVLPLLALSALCLAVLDRLWLAAVAARAPRSDG